MQTTIVYTVPHLAYWDWRVAADLFFGGIGVGAFLFTLLVDWRYQGKYRRICQTGAVMAPLFVVVGLLFLLSEMGHPFRVVYTLTTVQLKSPLWWGGIFQVLFILGTLVYAYQWFWPEQRATARRWVGWLTLPVALIVGAYHGLLLSAIRARPLWSTGPTTVAALLGFLTTGIAAVMIVHLVRMKLAGRLANAAWVVEFLTDMREVRNILGAALLLQLFTFFIWWLSLLLGMQPAQQALAAANAAWGPWFWFGAIGVGLVLPLLLGGVAMVRGSRIGNALEINTIWVTSGLILVGGFIFRLAVVLGGQMA